jgi:hypothetical protein
VWVSYKLLGARAIAWEVNLIRLPDNAKKILYLSGINSINWAPKGEFCLFYKHTYYSNIMGWRSPF